MKLNVRKPAVAGKAAPRGRCVARRAAAVEQTAVSKEVVDKCINTIRFLSIDAVNKANSGHPGAPMGCAPMSYVIWNEVMNYNPKNPKWINRDRFVLSIGHASMLQYSMLYLSGFDSVTVRTPNTVIAELPRLQSRSPSRCIAVSWSQSLCNALNALSAATGCSRGMPGKLNRHATCLCLRQLHMISATLSVVLDACRWTTSSNSASSAPRRPATLKTS